MDTTQWCRLLHDALQMANEMNEQHPVSQDGLKGDMQTHPCTIIEANAPADYEMTEAMINQPPSRASGIVPLQ